MADVANLNVRIGAKTEGLNKGVNDAQNTLKNLAGAIGIAFGGRELARFTQDTVKLSGIAEGVADAFDRLGKPGLLDDLVEATQGTVSQLELMQQAVKASNFKIPLDTLTSGLQFATRRAKETGESVDFLVNSFVTGIGRKSALVMDNLGISLTELQKEVKKTGDFATAVGNIMEREMSTWGEGIDTVSDKTQRLNATFDNTKVLIGDVASETLNLKNGLDDANEALEDFNTLIADDNVKEGFGDFIDFLVTSNPLFALVATNIEISKKALDRWAESIKKATPGRAGFGLGTGIPGGGSGDGKDTLEAAEARAEAYKKESELLEFQADVVNKNIASFESLKGVQSDVNKIVKIAQPILGGYVETLKEIPFTQEAINAAIIDFSDLLEDEAEVIDGSAEVMKQWVEDQASLAGKLKSVHNAIASSFTDMADDMTSALADLVTGDSGISGFFNNLLKMIAEFAISFGRLLTAIGAGLLLLGIGPGIALVGIGAGLMFAGKVASNIVESRQQNVNVSGELTASGNDLSIVLGRGNEFRQAVT